MPAGFESGVRLVEQYNGRGDATKQTRGVFPSVIERDINPGRVVRDRDNRITGIAAQDKDSITYHGLRPEASLTVDAKPEDLLIPLMAFFHNRAYTVSSAGPTNTAGDYVSDYRETGTFQFGMLDAKPDITGAVVGTYDDAAASYKEIVSISDLYTFGVEELLGHGDLGDTDNGREIDNFVVNRIAFSAQRGIDQDVQFEFGGFGRNGDDQADFAEASWGPGNNGEISGQQILTPDSMSIQVLDINSVDVISTWQDWLDAVTIELTNGLAPKDGLGFDYFNAVMIDGRPTVSGSITVPMIDPGFVSALANGHDFALTLRFSNGASEYVEITLPLLKISESFSPDVEATSEISHEIPFKGVVDADVVQALAEIEVATEFDVRTNSFFRDTTLADASTYTA